MRKIPDPTVPLLLAFLFAAVPAFAQPDSAPSQREARSVVRVQATSQPWDFRRPWMKKPPLTRSAVGAVLAGGRVLVTAELVANQIVVELETPQGTEKIPGTVTAVDPEANLALIEPADPAFLKSFTPLELSGPNVVGDRLEVWQLENEGTLLSTSALLTNIAVQPYPMDGTLLLAYQLTSAIQNREGSFTLPLTRNGKLAGFSMRFDPRTQNLQAIPIEIIRHFLAAAKPGPKSASALEGQPPGLTVLEKNRSGQESDPPGSSKSGEDADPPDNHSPATSGNAAAKPGYRGFPKAGMTFASTRDPMFRRHIGLNGKNGVYVTEVQPGGPAAGADIREGDILLSLAGKSIDRDGNFQHPVHGKISLIHLITGEHLDGDKVTAEILRDGKKETRELVLAVRPAADFVSPPYMLDEPPRFLIVGGLLFQELSRPYLREFGNNWDKTAPARLVYYDRYQTSLFPEGGRRVVFLSGVIPAKANIGYQDLDGLVVTTINDKQVRKLEDIAEAFKQDEGFLRIDFEDAPGFVVLDAREAREANAEIQAGYRLPIMERLNP